MVSTIGSFLTPLIGSMVVLALPQMAAEYSANAILVGWVPTIYILVTAMFLIPIGRISDIYGRKKVFLAGILIIALSSFCAPFSPSFPFLIACRALQGIGSACIFGTSVAIISSAFPREELGRALGVNVTGVYAGLALGPLIGGLLTQYLGWRSIFFVMVPVCILIIIIVCRFIHEEWIDPKSPQFDLPGSILYATLVFFGVTGITMITQPAGVIALFISLILLAVFIRHGMRTPFPVFDPRIFLQNRVFALSNTAALINYSSTFAISFLLSLYLQIVKGFSPQSAGLILIAQPLMQVLFSPWAGRLSDRYEPGIVASLGMGLNALGLFALSSITGETGILMLIMALLFIGSGMALFSSPNTNAVMRSVTPGEYGVASATMATMRQAGMAFSMGITLFLFTIYIGQAEIGPSEAAALVSAQQVAFWIYALLCIVGVLISLVRVRHP